MKEIAGIRGEENLRRIRFKVLSHYTWQCSQHKFRIEHKYLAFSWKISRCPYDKRLAGGISFERLFVRRSQSRHRRGRSAGYVDELYSRAFSADPFSRFLQPWLVKLYRKWIPEWERGINVRRDAGRKRTGYRNTEGARTSICTRSSALLVERPNQQTAAAAADITYKNFHCETRLEAPEAQCSFKEYSRGETIDFLFSRMHR